MLSITIVDFRKYCLLLSARSIDPPKMQRIISYKQYNFLVNAAYCSIVVSTLQKYCVSVSIGNMYPTKILIIAQSKKYRPPKILRIAYIKKYRPSENAAYSFI